MKRFFYVLPLLALLTSCTAPGPDLRNPPRDVSPFSTTVKVQEMNALFRDDARLDRAVAWCRTNGISKIYLETFRFGETVDEALLMRVKDRFERGGIATAGLVTPTMVGKPSTAWNVAGCWTDGATCRRLAEIFAFASRHFDTVLIDDFFFASCECDACRAAKGSRDWGVFRRAQMREVAERYVLAPARAANPHVRVIVKYPCWYPEYPQRGYDVGAEAGLFGRSWVGTETRDWAWRTRKGTVPMAAFFLMRWADDAAGGRCGGGWYDPLWTSPAVYLEQARLTILGGARESVLHSYGYLAYTEEEGRALGGDVVGRLGLQGVGGLGSTNGPACCAAFREHLPELRALAQNVARRRLTGIAAWKPVNASERGDERWYERLAMTGLPIDPVSAFPSQAPAAAFSACVLDHPEAERLVAGYAATGKPTLLSCRLAEAWKGRPWLTAANVRIVPRKESSWEFCNLPPERLAELRGFVLPVFGIKDFRAPNRVGLILFTDGSRVILNFDDSPASITLDHSSFTLSAHSTRCFWR